MPSLLATGESASIWGECYRSNASRMSGERGKVRSCFRVPQPHCAVRISSRDRFFHPENTLRSGHHPWGRLSVFLSCPVLASHNRAVLSRLPVAIVFPSGEYTTELTSAVCPFNVVLWAPVWASHNDTVLSKLPVATVFPIGRKRHSRDTICMPFKRGFVRACLGIP